MLFRLSVGFIFTLLDMFYYSIFLSVFFIKRRSNLFTGCVFVVYLALYYAVTYYFKSPTFKIILVLILYGIVGLITYKGKAVTIIILSVIFWVVNNIIDFLVSMGSSFFLHQNTLTVIGNSTNALLIIGMMSKLLMYISILLLRFLWKQNIKRGASLDFISTKEYMLLFALAIVSFCSFCFLIYADTRTLPNSFVNSGFGIFILIINLLIFSIIAIITRRHAAEIECKNLIQEVWQSKRYIQTITTSQKLLQRQAHEFKNQTYSALGLLRQGHVDEAICYLQSMARDVTNNMLNVKTGNIYFDALLNQKYIEASTNGINITIECNDCSNFNTMSPIDLVVLLGNTIDNGIEASLRNAVKKELRVRIHVKNKQLIYSVVNYVDEQVDFKISSKKGANHGFGLVNVFAVLEKYNAEHTIYCENHYVHMIVMVDELQND